MNCPSCNAEVMEIDVKCASCGAAIGATGAHRMIGQVILSQYELVDVLGQGGMSVVFKARHQMTQQEVALKILPPELAAHSQVKSRFLDEAKALASLDHPNIVHLYNFGQENGSFVLAMQYVKGKTWERVILEAKRLDWKLSCRMAVDVLKALEYAHDSGIVHRDMKPSNVLVRAHDGSATVMDFGIAKMAQSTRLTATGQTMGTVRYMSPEQVRGQEVDLRTDIYSLGATLYESVVGDTPFDGTTHFEIMSKHLSEAPKRPSALGIEIPVQVEDALMRSLAKRAEDRFENARDMRKILEATLKEYDVALVETSRLNRDSLGDLRPAKRDQQLGLQATTRAATANALADALEPGTSSAHTLARRAKWPWLVAAGLVVGGAGTAIVVMSGLGGGGYHPKTPIHGVTAGKRFEDLHVLVETDGKLTPDEVANAYRSTLAELGSFDAKLAASFHGVDEIVAIPRAALCDGSTYIYSGNAAPDDCSAALAEPAFGKGATHELLVVDDRASLPGAMRSGVARAACDFQPESVDQARLGEICELSKRFAAAK